MGNCIGKNKRRNHTMCKFLKENRYQNEHEINSYIKDLEREIELKSTNKV